jgi:hypothetical protein
VHGPGVTVAFLVVGGILGEGFGEEQQV